MAVISTASLYESTKRRFSIGQSRLDSFRASFLAAYNDTLFDLYNVSLIDEPSLLTDIDEDSAVEERYLPQIKEGIRYFLQSEGEWVKGDDVNKYAGLNWERAKGTIANAIVKDTETDGTYTGPWGDE